MSKSRRTLAALVIALATTGIAGYAIASSYGDTSEPGVCSSTPPQEEGGWACYAPEQR